MTKKIIIGVFVFFLLINFKIAYSEVFIKAKVNNHIITNIDVKNERNYLLALNPNLRNLSQENINLYAVDSAINEKIKKIEIEKKFEITPEKKIVKKVITDLYSGIGINNMEEFEKYLLDYEINIGMVKKKIAIEIAWNDYIVSKFNSAILVDEAKIRNKINQISTKSSVENLLLSEIIFTINENENLKAKFDKINESIKKIGFEETAKIYSVSESKKNGGQIGWVYKSQLSNKIFEQVKNLNIGQSTDAIAVPGGFILIKLNDKKNQLLETDKEEQFKKALNFERNRQLTMYSTLHYKRVYNKAVINEF
tara:strand:+ start:636 stop:1565 length:930 start_codon:yes stop_codon:yes gene_type:complete